MNVLNFFDFCEWAASFPEVSIFLTKVDGPEYYSVDCIQPSFRQELIDRATALRASICDLHKSFVDQYIEALSTVNPTVETYKFKQILSRNDKIRGTDFRTVFKEELLLLSRADRKVVGFGDSFMSTGEYNWITVTGDTLGCEVVNYGYAGSALHYSLLQLIEYSDSTNYSPNDVLVFVTTSSNRLYTVNMPTPGLGISATNASLYMSLGKTENQKKNNKWVNQNLDNLLWVVENMYHHSINIELILTLSFLKVWADAHPSNKLIVLHAFSIDSPLSTGLFPMITQTSNFIPLINNPPLSAISNAEFKSTPSYAGVDARTNHLSKENVKILGEMIASVIENNRASDYDTSKFVTAIYNTYEDMLKDPK